MMKNKKFKEHLEEYLKEIDLENKRHSDFIDKIHIKYIKKFDEVIEK
jgi:hypothetical protein